MVVRPQDILHDPRDDAAEIAERERKIDTELKKAKQQRFRGGILLINRELLGEDPVIIQALIDKYQAVGWKVTKYEAPRSDHSDARDDGYQFTC